jgi:hypothetical protein
MVICGSKIRGAAENNAAAHYDGRGVDSPRDLLSSCNICAKQPEQLGLTITYL